MEAGRETMNRREFLHTVGGVAAIGTAYSSGLDAVGGLLQATPREARRAVVLIEPGFPPVDAPAPVNVA